MKVGPPRNGLPAWFGLQRFNPGMPRPSTTSKPEPPSCISARMPCPSLSIDAWIPARQLSRLDPPPAAALPHFTSALHHPTVGVSAGRYLSRLGTHSRSALPALERTFVPTNSAEGLFAAMLLLEVAGDHPSAESVIRTWAESTSFTPWNELTPSWVIPSLGSLGRMLSVRHPATLAAISAPSKSGAWNRLSDNPHRFSFVSSPFHLRP